MYTYVRERFLKAFKKLGLKKKFQHNERDSEAGILESHLLLGRRVLRSLLEGYLFYIYQILSKWADFVLEVLQDI